MFIFYLFFAFIARFCEQSDQFVAWNRFFAQNNSPFIHLQVQGSWD